MINEQKIKTYNIDQIGKNIPDGGVSVGLFNKLYQIELYIFKLLHIFM